MCTTSSSVSDFEKVQTIIDRMIPKIAFDTILLNKISASSTSYISDFIKREVFKKQNFFVDLLPLILISQNAGTVSMQIIIVFRNSPAVIIVQNRITEKYIQSHCKLWNQ